MVSFSGISVSAQKFQTAGGEEIKWSHIRTVQDSNIERRIFRVTMREESSLNKFRLFSLVLCDTYALKHGKFTISGYSEAG